MMKNLLRRGEEIADAAQQKRVRELARNLGAFMGSDAIETQEAAVLVSGRGLMKRWLVDPGLRFFSRGLK